MEYEWAVLWGGIVIFVIIPAGVIAYAMMAVKNIKADDPMAHIGSQDVDIRLKRFKNQ